MISTARRGSRHLTAGRMHASPSTSRIAPRKNPTKPGEHGHASADDDRSGRASARRIDEVRSAQHDTA
jgi:hypothetical protein